MLTVAFAPLGARAAPVSFSRTLEIFDPLADPTGAHFGATIAAFGSTIAVGMQGKTSIFLFSSATGLEVRELTGAWTGFGTSLALVGSNLSVGAPGGVNGRVYVFNPANGDLVNTLSDTYDPVAGDSEHFGFSLGSIRNNLTIGVPDYNIKHEECIPSWPTDICFWVTDVAQAGAVRVVDASSELLRQTLLDPSPAPGDRFGYAVATSGNKVLVGAPLNDTSGVTDSGAVFVFDGISGSLLLRINSTSPKASGQFGSSVAWYGKDILVGAPGQTVRTQVCGGRICFFQDLAVGAAYLFNGTDGRLLQTFFAPNGAAGDLFGQSLATLQNRVVIGAPSKDAGQTDTGAAYLFNPASGALVDTFDNPSPEPGNYFGYALATLGWNVYVGAIFEDSWVMDAGKVYAFRESVAPVTTGVLAGTPGANGWYTSGVTLTLSAKDAGSGVARTVYNSGGGWLDYLGSGLGFGDGVHNVSFYSTDLAGNAEATQTVTFSVDTTPPALTLEAPVDGATTNKISATISGTTEASANLVVNGMAVDVGSDGAFSMRLALAEGSNTITATATSPAGQVTTVTRSLTVDSMAPTIDLSSPVGGLTRSSSVVVSGTVSEPGAVVKVNGQTATVAASGAFTMTLSLTEGSHNIDVTATDAAGNVGSAGASVVVDTVAPTVTVTSPAVNAQVGTSTVLVQGTVSDPSATVLVNGIQVQPESDGSWSANLALVEGVNTISVSAMDAAGNVGAAATQTVTYNTPVTGLLIGLVVVAAIAGAIGVGVYLLLNRRMRGMGGAPPKAGEEL